MRRRYLDHNATTPLGAAARDKLASTMAADAPPLGNPSSIHAAGRAARQLVETARAEVAALVGARADAVIFTSGGTEAIALGLLGLARRARARDPRRTRVLVGATEHPAVQGAAEALVEIGFSMERLAVDDAGRVDVARVQLDERVAVVAVQAANHETGVLQPVTALAAAARGAGAPLLCDAVQAAGKLPLAIDELCVAALCVSAHKLYGPTGVGALVLGEAIDVAPLVPGGPQERGRRAGTESAWALAGFGAAARESAVLLAAEAPRQRDLRLRLEDGLVELGARIFGAGAERGPNTTLCAFPGVSGQLLVMALDLEGFEVSTGAACSSGSLRPSAVLLAAGHPLEVARGAVRISIGRATHADDLDALLAALPPLLARIRGATGA